MGISSYNPARPGKEGYNGTQAPAKDWMSLAEYDPAPRLIHFSPFCVCLFDVFVWLLGSSLSCGVGLN